jgi:hypothetical protein
VTVLRTCALACALLALAACARGDGEYARTTRQSPPASASASPASPAPVVAPSAADTARARSRFTNPDVDPQWIPVTFPAADDERQRLTTLDGVLTITADSTGGEIPISTDFHVLVDGHEIQVEVDRVIDLGIYASRQDFAPSPEETSGTLVVLESSFEANTCPARYYVLLMMMGKPPLLSKPFGNCGDAPAVTLTDHALRMRFPGFYTTWQSMQRGFREPPGEAYEYRGGEMVKLSPREHQGRGR